MKEIDEENSNKNIKKATIYFDISPFAIELIDNFKNSLNEVITECYIHALTFSWQTCL